jgi:hypothetical protein
MDLFCYTMPYFTPYSQRIDGFPEPLSSDNAQTSASSLSGLGSPEFASQLQSWFSNLSRLPT